MGRGRVGKNLASLDAHSVASLHAHGVALLGDHRLAPLRAHKAASLDAYQVAPLDDHAVAPLCAHGVAPFVLTKWLHLCSQSGSICMLVNTLKGRGAGRYPSHRPWVP
jgi:hypothetical protein